MASWREVFPSVQLKISGPFVLIVLFPPVERSCTRDSRAVPLKPLWPAACIPVKRHITEETIPVKQKWHGHSAFRIEAGEAKILIDSFLSDNPSKDSAWSGCLTGKHATRGGDR